MRARRGRFGSFTVVELIFVACLMHVPNECEERAMVFTEITPHICVMGAQPELARWASTNPNWAISSWKCRYVDTRSADI